MREIGQFRRERTPEAYLACLQALTIEKWPVFRQMYVCPILMGSSKPVHVLQCGAAVEEIVTMAAIAVTQVQLGSNIVELRAPVKAA